MNTALTARSARDPRLDVWRGIAMLIIMVAHIPGNFWGNWIPARFGPSDAAEMFVFCSGYAAALAFGGTFDRHGWWMGTRRVLFRCWQIYWAHIGLFIAIALISVLSTDIVGEDVKNYVVSLNIIRFFNDTETALIGFLTMTWVPNYFDILPMYFVILLMMPIVMALRGVHPIAPFIFCIGLYVATWVFDLEFPAEPWSDRSWFFNPLGWQLLFFTGFFLARGWINPPPFDWRLIVAGILFILILIPLSRWQIYTRIDPFMFGGLTIDLKLIHDIIWIRPRADLASYGLEWLRPWIEYWDQALVFKTNQHLLRYLHILVLTYLCVCLVRGREHLLRRWPVTILERVGQQALAVFLWSMAFARVCGVALDMAKAADYNVTIGSVVLPLGKDLTVALVNLTGIFTCIGVAYMVGWYKSQPWRQRRDPAPPQPQPTAA